MKLDITKEELLGVYWCIKVNTDSQLEDLGKLGNDSDKDEIQYYRTAYETSLAVQTKLEKLAEDNNINLFE